ncbi:uncharacterized protein RHO17_001772 isoform 1-T1 [Thomomys bottae]
MATYPPRRLLGARPLPSDPRRDPRRSGFPEGGGGGGGGGGGRPRQHVPRPALQADTVFGEVSFPRAEPLGSARPLLCAFLLSMSRCVFVCVWRGGAEGEGGRGEEVIGAGFQKPCCADKTHASPIRLSLLTPLIPLGEL